MSTILGKPITMGGGGKLPDIFGDGSDGDLVIKAGETVTLEVPVPHQSVVEKNYKSSTIEAGGTLTTADYNAGLVLRCQGDCNISGTIDQSGKAPKTNPDSTYPYPEELVCGDGGAGGSGRGYENAGAPMSARPYGGGYGSGGMGGSYVYYDNDSGAWENVEAGEGGSTTAIDLTTSNLFVGGSGGNPAGDGVNGGGGGGWPNLGGNGGTGAGATGGNGTGSGSGSNYGTGGGGAGNVGGGVVLLYAGGSLSISGDILCNGLNGGTGGTGLTPSGVNLCACGGAGGGGGGGGAIYIVYMSTQTVTGSLNVNGGTGGSPGGSVNASASYYSSAGTPGSIGTTTIKQYEEGMTA